MPEIAIASPVVEVDARIADRNDVLKIIGIDAFRAAGVQPGLVAAGRGPSGSPALRRAFLESRGVTLARHRCRGEREPAERVARRCAARRGIGARRRGTAFCGHGYRRCPDEFRSRRSHHPRRPAREAGRRCRQLSRSPASAVAGRARRPASRSQRRRQREPVALVPRQHECPRAGCTVHRRPARFLDAGARRRAAARATGAAARAGRDATAVDIPAGRRRRGDWCRRQRARADRRIRACGNRHPHHRARFRCRLFSRTDSGAVAQSPRAGPVLLPRRCDGDAGKLRACAGSRAGRTGACPQGRRSGARVRAVFGRSGLRS